MYNKKSILKVSYPIFLGLLAQNIINVTDTAFLGHVGEVELGASAIGGLYYICFFILAFGFSIGAQILMARRNGEANYDQIGPILTQGSLFSFLIAVVLLAVSLLTARPMMRLMLSSEEIISEAEVFFSWRVWGVLFSFVNTMFRAFYISVTRTKVLTWNAVVMAAVNIVLDWALIYGRLGLPAMGLRGAALASVIAEAVSLAFFFLYTLRTVDLVKYNLRFTLRLDRQRIGAILGISTFVMFQQFIPFATWFVFFLAIEHLGQRELAIANIVRSIYIIVLIPVNAFQTTVNTLVSNTMGAGCGHKVLSTINRVTRMSFGISLVCAAVIFLIPGKLLSIYSQDPELIAQAVPSLYVIAVGLLIASISNVQFSGISGTGNARSALWIELPCQVGYMLYIFMGTWLLKWPVEMCFTCEIVYYVSLSVLSMLYLRFGRWRDVSI